MKILYIIESMRSGGKERRLLSLIKGLSNKENVTCELLLLTGSVHYKEIYNQNLIIHHLERNIRKDRKIISKFKQLLQASQPDIVHCWDNILLHRLRYQDFQNFTFHMPQVILFLM